MRKNRVFINFINWLEENGYIKKSAKKRKSVGIFKNIFRLALESRVYSALFNNISQMHKIKDVFSIALKKYRGINSKTSNVDDEKRFENDFLVTTKVSNQCIYFLKKKENREKIEKFIDEMRLLRDPKYGKHPIRDIIYPEKYYQPINGQSNENMPDMILDLNEDYRLFFKSGEKTFDYDIKNHDYIAFHRRDGFYLISGKNIKSNTYVDAEIYDIAPTILHMFGVPLSKEMDGRVLKEIFIENCDMSNRDIVYEENNEKSKLKQKIKGLRSIKKI